LPAPPEPLPQMALQKNKKVTAITGTYKDKSGTARTEALDSTSLGEKLQDHFPRRAAEDGVQGSATIDCYIAGDYRVDVCLIQQEYPPGYDFGRVLEEIYDGVLTVPDHDAAGLATDHRVFRLKLQWLIG